MTNTVSRRCDIDRDVTADRNYMLSLFFNKAYYYFLAVLHICQCLSSQILVLLCRPSLERVHCVVGIVLDLAYSEHFTIVLVHKVPVLTHRLLLFLL